MRNTTSGVLLAAGLGAVATAQGRGFDGFEPAASSRPPAMHPGPVDVVSGGGVAPSVRARLDAAAQDTDYSQRALFQQNHGDFMLKRERFDPAIELRAQMMPGTEIQNETGQFDMGRAGIDAQIPFYLADGWVSAGAFFDVRRFETEDMPGFPNESLYATGLDLGFGAFVDDNVLFEGMIRPGIWSDLEGTLHTEDFDFPCGLLFTIRSTEDVFFKIGARYNEIYEDANVLPWLGVSWYVMPEFRIDILAPEYLEISWWPTPEFGVLAGAEIQGEEYRVRMRNTFGVREYADARTQEVIAYGGVMWRMSDYVSLAGRAGLTVAGDYKLDEGLAATARIDGTLRPTFFAEVTFGLDF